MLNFAKAAKESLIQYDILKYLNGLPNCKAVKILKANEEGTPDIFCCYRGMAIVLEVKASAEDADRATIDQKRQLMQLEQWHQAGAWTRYVWSLGSVKKIIGYLGTKI